MLKKGKKWLKSIDSFGYVIPINFNKKGSRHNTLIGGILSLICNILIFLFFVFCINKAINHLQNNNALFSSLLDLEIMGPKDYSQMNFGIFVSISAGSKISQDTPITEVQKYIQMYAINSQRGTNKKENQVNLKWCTQKDFGVGESAKQIFKTYSSSDAFKILCPDLDPSLPFMLQSDNQQQLYSRIDFVFSRCQNSTQISNCKSNEEIDKYLSDVQLQIYRFNQEFDFTIYGQIPINTVVQKLEHHYVVTQEQQSFKIFQYMLQKNEWSSADSFFQIGQADYEGTYFDIGYGHSYDVPVSTSPGCILQIRLRLYSELVTYSRVTYSFINIIGDIGGAFSALLLIFQPLAFPFAKNSFLIKYVKKLYLAKTKNKKIFYTNEIKDKQDERINFKGQIKETDQKFKQKLENEYLSHKIIRLTLWDSFLLYFSGYECFQKVIPNFKELNIIYNYGLKRIDKDLNIANIVKQLRRLKIASSLNMDDQLNFEIEHSLRNLICLDRDEKFHFNLKQNSLFENSNEDIDQNEIELEEQAQQRNQKKLLIRQQQIKNQLQEEIRLVFRRKFLKQKKRINLQMNYSEKKLINEINTQRSLKNQSQSSILNEFFYSSQTVPIENLNVKKKNTDNISKFQ